MLPVDRTSTLYIQRARCSQPAFASTLRQPQLAVGDISTFDKVFRIVILWNIWLGVHEEVATKSYVSVQARAISLRRCSPKATEQMTLEIVGKLFFRRQCGTVLGNSGSCLAPAPNLNTPPNSQNVKQLL